jgi:hypothetical protein
MTRERNPRSSGRWLPLAALATLALVAALWAGLGRDSSAPIVSFGDAQAAGPLLPEAADDGAASALGPSEAPAPSALSANRASLTLRIEAVGVIASQPFVRVTSHATGESETRSLVSRLETSWPAMPPGRYSLEPLGDAWLVDEPEVTLAGGDVREIALSPRRMAVVRVVGGLSGKLMSSQNVRLQARPAGSESEVDIEMTTPESSNAGSFALLGLPATLPDGRAIEGLRVFAHAGRDLLVSDWVSPAAIEAAPTIMLRVPEPVVVGHVRRAAAGDGLDGNSAAAVQVRMHALDRAAAARVIDEQQRTLPPDMVRALSGTASAEVGRDGSYELRLAALPAGPVRLTASNRVDPAAESEPFTLDQRHLPLTVDFVLPARGTLRGIVRTGLTTGQRSSSYSLQKVFARRLDTELPDQFLTSDFVRQPDDVGAEYARLNFLVGSLEAGDYEVTVILEPTPDGDSVPGRELVQRVHVDVGAPTPIEFDASASAALATLRGTVLLPPQIDDEARANLEILLTSDDRSRLRRSARLSPDGRYAFADVQSGDWVVCVRPGRQELHFPFPFSQGSSPRAASGRRAVRVDRSDVLVPPLDLTRPELRIQLPAELGRVDVVNTQRESFSLTADDSGLAQVWGLEPGRYEAWPRGVGVGRSTPFEIPAGASVVTVELP